MPLSNRLTDAMDTYAALMGELKIRIGWLQYAAQGRTGMDGQMVREFGFLQLRMCCELVALACLVAHGDLEATKSSKFQSTGSADDIMKSLEKLNPNCFPHAVVMTSPGPNRHHFEERPEADYMTKAEFYRLYARECGSILHKGNLKNLLKPTSPVQKSFPELFEPAQKLLFLLGQHKIALDDGYLQFICLLGDFSEDVRIIIGEAPRAGEGGDASGGPV